MNLVPVNPERNELKHWIFRLYKGPFYVRVQGYRESKGKDKKLECWLTSPISYCENPQTLISISGRRYILKGGMDTDLACIYQYPSFIVNVFKDGFPDNWERILRPLHQMMNLDSSLNCMITFSPLKSISPEFQKLKNLTKKVKATPKSSKAESIFLPDTNAGREVVPVRKASDSFYISRSGRVIKPRLQKSEGERISYDIYGNPIAAYCVITKAPNKPDYSEKLAAICDGIGVSRFEHSKQSHRFSAAFDTPPSSSRLNKSGSKRKKLVNYSSSEDSFCAFVDRISLPSEDEADHLSHNKTTDDILTPIRFNKCHARRIIQSDKRSVKVKKEKEIKHEKNKIKKEKVKKPVALPVPYEESDIEMEIIDNILPETPKKKRWTVEDTKRLKIALKAGNPQTAQDWNAIARSVSADSRSGEECRKQAIKIKWKPTKAPATPEQSSNPRNAAEKRNRAARNNKSISGQDNADFFTQKNYNMSLLDLDPNDSLLSVLKTPTEEAKFIRKPFLMQQVLNETRRSLRSNENLDETLF